MHETSRHSPALRGLLLAACLSGCATLPPPPPAPTAFSQPPAPPDAGQLQQQLAATPGLATSILEVPLDGASIPVQRLTIDEAVLFDFAQATPRPDAAPVLTHLAAWLAAAPPRAITLVGHTDAIGSDAYNDELSRARARSVATALQAQGAAPSVTLIAMGRRQPLASNATEAGRARNRRVELFLSASQQANAAAIRLRPGAGTVPILDDEAGTILPAGLLTLIDTRPAPLRPTTARPTGRPVAPPWKLNRILPPDDLRRVLPPATP